METFRLVTAGAAAICTGVSVAAILYARTRSALKRRLRATEHVEIGSARPGVVELIGRAYALEPAVCPVRQTPGVLWRWKLRRPSRNAAVDLAVVEHVAPFVLDDGTGRVLVLPLPKEVDLPERRWHEPKGSGRDTIKELSALAGLGPPGWFQRRWIDGWSVREGASLYVHGDAHEIGPDEAHGEAEGASLVLEGALVVSTRGEDELVNEQETDVILAWVIAVIIGLVAAFLLSVAVLGERALT